MGKQTKKEVKKVFQLLTTAQSNAYKEQVKKEGQVLYAGTGVELQKHMQTNPDPNYLSIFKKTGNGIQQVHQLDELQQNQYHYDPKAKRDRHFNMKRQLPTKDSLNYPLTSNQEYGWRQPLDIGLEPKYGIKQTFDEKLVVTLKGKGGVPKK